MERNIERILREARYVLENKCTVREGYKKSRKMLQNASKVLLCRYFGVR